MKWKTIITLLILMLSLGVLSTWEESHVKSDKQEKMNSKLVFGIQKKLPVKITWMESNKLKFELILKGERWHLARPVKSIADQKVVNSIVNSLLDYKFTKKIYPKSTRLHEFGITEESRRIILNFEENGKLVVKEFIIGSSLSTGYHTYSMMKGDEFIYVGSQYLSILTNRTATEIRKKTFIDFDINQLKELSLYNKNLPSGQLTLSYQDGQMIISKPKQYLADQIEVNKFLKTLVNMKAVGFYGSKDKEIDQLKNIPYKYRIKWVLRDGLKSSVDFFTMEGRLWAALDLNKRAYRLPPHLEKTLNRSLLSLRHRNVYEFKISQIKKIIIDKDAYSIESGQWLPAIKMDQSLTHDLLKALLIDMQSIKTARFIDLDKFQSLRKNQPFKVIKLKKQNEDILSKFWETENGFLVEVQGKSSLYEIPKEFFSFLDPKFQSSHSHDEH